MQDPQTWNRYSYTENRPLAYTDPNGEWSTPVHDYIIDQAFTGILSATDRSILKRASLGVDKDQSMSGAHKHGMRAAWQSPMEAMAQGDAFIQQNLQAAVIAQMAFEKENAVLGPYLQGLYSHDALWHFGEALHTVTDRASPWHGYHDEAWMGIWNPPAAGRHGIREATVGWSREGAIGMAIYEARLLWFRFQMMLEEAREEEKQKEKKKKKEEDDEDDGGDT